MRIISGRFRGKKLKAPPGLSTRPTSDRAKESVFNILGNTVNWDGCAAADIFAGSGSLGIECLSRGAAECLFVECDRTAENIIRQNLKSINMENCATFVKDYLLLKTLQTPAIYDVIFIDPPYHQDLIPLTLNALLAGQLLHHNTAIVAECAKDEDIAVPSEFSVDQQRVYGKSKMIFLHLGKMTTIAKGKRL